MDLLGDLLKLSVGGTAITTIIIYLGKHFISKSSDVLLENHKNKLELTKVEYQIKFSKLHSDRGIVVKEIYQDFYELKKTLEYLTTMAQGPEWKTDKKRVQKAITKHRESVDLFEINRIYFSEELCDKILETLTGFKDVIYLMMKAQTRAQVEEGEIKYKIPHKGEWSIELWEKAENKVENEINLLRLDLANEFRELIGV